MPPKRPAPVRRNPMEAPSKEEAHKINNRIESREVRLIDAEGTNVGVVQTRAALIMAEEAGLDLVEISPDAKPPVAKILDYGKFKFQEQKRLAEARKKQRVVEIKEIKLRPMIDDHDYEVKMKAAKRFFEEGDKVKVTLRFRGREMDHQELGHQLLAKVKTDMVDIAKVELDARFEGRQIIMILAPKATK
nr:translation initiation factor IF-3 [Aestuariivirga litoralis]